MKGENISEETKRWLEKNKDKVEEGIKAGKKVWDVIGNDAQCNPFDAEGLFCLDQNNNKVFQITVGGSSVSKLNIPEPKDYDFEQNGFKVKVLNEHCRVSTANKEGENRNTVAICYKDNVDPFLTDIGDNLEEMNKMLDDLL